MTTITGNDERDSMLKRAIAECIALNEPIVFGNVRDLLPSDFELGDDEFAAAMKLTPADAPAPEPLPISEDVPEVKLTRDQAQHMMDMATVRLENARIAVQVARENCRVARGVREKAIIAWTEQGEPMSAEARQQREVRNHLASEQAARAARGTPHGGANQFVQKHMRNGPSRGAFSRAAATRLGFRMPGTGNNGN